MMQKVVTNSCEHPLEIHENLLLSDFSRTTCSQDKLIIRPPTKELIKNSLHF